MIKNRYENFCIKTDFMVNSDFFSNYFTNNWQDSNILYKEYVSKATNGKQMKKFYVQEIHSFDRPLLKLISFLFKEFQIKPKEFRCNFFRVLPGGKLPLHVDQKSELSFCIPVTENTGYTFFKENDIKLLIKYDSMLILNTKKPHGVTSPEKERIVFHMGIHDIPFEELK